MSPSQDAPIAGVSSHPGGIRGPVGNAGTDSMTGTALAPIAGGGGSVASTALLSGGIAWNEFESSEAFATADALRHAASCLRRVLGCASMP